MSLPFDPRSCLGLLARSAATEVTVPHSDELERTKDSNNCVRVYRWQQSGRQPEVRRPSSEGQRDVIGLNGDVCADVSNNSELKKKKTFSSA